MKVPDYDDLRGKRMKPESPYTNLETILEELSEPPSPVFSILGIVIGRLVAFTPESGPLVDFPCNPVKTPRAARSTVPLDRSCEGSQVTLMFEGGSPTKPIVTGVLLDHLQRLATSKVVSVQDQEVRVQSDGASLVLRAEEEIVLECGKASITLTKAGKVLIKGEYVLSRSAGANKIKGGSVQIN